MPIVQIYLSDTDYAKFKGLDLENQKILRNQFIASVKDK